MSRGIVGFAIILVLCLPSLVGGTALLSQLLLHRNMSEWNESAAALTAFGSIFGGPMVAIAAVVGAVVSLRQVPATIKYASLSLVLLAAVATLFLLISFAK